MAERCPLCLGALSSADALIRFCPCHPNLTDRFLVTPENYRRIFCQHPQCNDLLTIARQTFLLHEGCESQNPFWKNGQVIVPPQVQWTDKDDRVHLVKHWELALLEQIAEKYPGRREMWFPALLFRAANRDRETSRVGTLVKLSGARNVGKTTLAVMALNPWSYACGERTPDLGHIQSDHFVYAFNERLAQPETVFAQALEPSWLFLRAETTQQWTYPTSRLIKANVRAVFVRPKESMASLPTASRDEINPMSLLWRTFKRATMGPYIAVPDGESHPPPSHSAVVFLDTAGEENEDPYSVKLGTLEECVDVIAVTLDATHLSHFSGRTSFDARMSIPVAVQRIKSIATKRARRCLIVTKVDLVSGGLQPLEKEYVSKIAQDGNLHPDCDKQMLLAWLAEGDSKEKELAALVSGEAVHKVFFIWTEGLGVLGGDPPRAIGLLRFVAWCLNEGA